MASYLLANLPIGPYRMEVSKEGFATFVQRGIVLNVNTNPTINATMKLGAVTETVQVEANAVAVETHSTGVGQIIDHQEVAELPLNAREPTQLILLAGIATTQGAVANDLNSNKNFPTITISVAGGNANTDLLLPGWRHGERSLQRPQPAAALPRCAPGIQGGNQFRGRANRPARSGVRHGRDTQSEPTHCTATFSNTRAIISSTAAAPRRWCATV